MIVPVLSSAARTSWPRSQTSEVAALYRTHAEYVWQVLRKLGVPEHASEDAVHDVFVVVHRRWRDFEGRSGVRTWLFAIARRVASRHRRTDARTQRRHVALALQPMPSAELPDLEVARRQAWTALLEFLDGLDADHRDAFVLGELEGATRKVMGRVLGINPNTAYTRLQAARRAFAATFGDGHERAAVAKASMRVGPHRKRRVWVAVLASSRMASATAIAAGIATSWVTAAGLFVAIRSAIAPPVLPDPPPPAAVVTESVDPRPLAPRPEPSTVPTPRPIEPAIEAAAPRPRRSRPTPSPTPVPDPSAAMAKLTDARRALHAGRADEALERLEQSRALDPDDSFAAERIATSVWALCELRREDEARRQLRALLDRDPASAYIAVLSKSCVGASIMSSPPGDQES